MIRKQKGNIAEARRSYARLMAAASKTSDPRLERVFELVPREAFLPPGPWKIMVDNEYFDTPSADPVYLYQNALVALDAAKGINNGEPFLHAAWLGSVAPQRGDVVCHIGAGSGYYTAILSVLALPGGRVEAFEIEPGLAEAARKNLRAFEGVTVTQGDATKLPLPASDLIYVNAGVLAPPRSWLQALRPKGRLIFPWRPSDEVGLTLLITRTDAGFDVEPLMNAWFIACVGGASTADLFVKPPDAHAARSVRSAWLTSERVPDKTAVAAYQHVWFSSSALG
ncbi:protein-L-isoaspartate O-methyltransferase family protein [Caballeronia sp. LjRoot31]|uniref:protein-L-isoaspartate O-methyltransferase family protein n=1 Tax=Caballeronia sp. LjRoot31 TaxID=3342324 RepID=UPI003ECC4B97